MAEEMLIQKFVNVELNKILVVLRTFDSDGIFSDPVAVKWPSLAREYRQKISHPMDLGTMGQKVEQNKYRFFQLDTFTADFTLIGNNCMEFNRPKEGEVNTYYDVGVNFLKRGLAYVNPIIEALKARIAKCREGEFSAPEIGNGLDFTEKPLPKVDDDVAEDEEASGDDDGAGGDEEKENKETSAAEENQANGAAEAEGEGQGGSDAGGSSAS